jgi:hypothetical protein
MALCPDGRAAIFDLRALLETRGELPRHILTSHWEHAVESGELLGGCPTAETVRACETGKPRPADRVERAGKCVRRLNALTPKSCTHGFKDLLLELNDREPDGAVFRDGGIVAVVGHEPRLSQILTEITSSRHRPIERGQVVCVSAGRVEDLMVGRGSVDFRDPVVDHHEEGLREKIRSKASISTLFAGFTAAALFDLLVENMGRPVSTIVAVQATLLTAAVALFVASLYMYDRMSMPEGFWEREGGRSLAMRWLELAWGESVLKVLAPPRRWLRGGWSWAGAHLPRPITNGFARIGSTWNSVLKDRHAQREDDWRRQGPLFVYMVRTWRWVFGSGVLFAAAALVAMLIDSDHPGLQSAAIAVFIAVTAVYHRLRPRLGVD